MHLFHEVSQSCSKITTEKYSTSFCSAIRLLHHDLRKPIFNIYGFVRFADEIVATFPDYNKSNCWRDSKLKPTGPLKKG
jgi:phytoene/squalene synthetase